MESKEISSVLITNVMATSVHVRLVTDGEMEDPDSKARIQVTIDCYETDISQAINGITAYLTSLPTGLTNSFGGYGSIMQHTMTAVYDEDTHELDFGRDNFCIINIDYVESKVKEAAKKFLEGEVLRETFLDGG